MSQLKRYTCQLAKILTGTLLAVIGIIAIVAFATLAGEVLVYLLDHSVIARATGCLLLALVVLGVGFLIGDDIFRKYNICQRFK